MGLDRFERGTYKVDRILFLPAEVPLTIHRPIRVDYRTVPELVYSRLRENILDGVLAPGEWIRQDVIARDMEISKIPVREALRRLESDGLVQFEPNRGARVAGLSIEDLQELYVVRAALEPFAARIALPLITSEDLVQMQANLDTQKDLRLSGDALHLSRVTREFHFILYRRTGRQRLCDKIAGLWDGCRRYQRVYLQLPGRTDWTIDDHQEMLDACRSRDSIALESSVREHVVTIAAGAEAALASRIASSK